MLKTSKSHVIRFVVVRRKTVEAVVKAKVKVTSSGEEEGRKGKCKYIAYITSGTMGKRNSSKGTMKRKISQLMAINKTDVNTSTKRSERPILGLLDDKKIEGIPKEIFTFVIKDMVANFDISMVIVDGKDSYDIMYSNIFEKMELNKDKLWPYERFDLQAFNDTITRIRGYNELMVTLEEGKDTRIIDSQFLVVP